MKIVVFGATGIVGRACGGHSHLHGGATHRHTVRETNAYH